MAKFTRPRLDELRRGPDVDGQDVVPDGGPAVLAVDEALFGVQSHGLGVHQQDTGEPRHVPQVDVTLLQWSNNNKNNARTDEPEKGKVMRREATKVSRRSGAKRSEVVLQENSCDASDPTPLVTMRGASQT